MRENASSPSMNFMSLPSPTADDNLVSRLSSASRFEIHLLKILCVLFQSIQTFCKGKVTEYFYFPAPFYAWGTCPSCFASQLLHLRSYVLQLGAPYLCFVVVVVFIFEPCVLEVHLCLEAPCSMEISVVCTPPFRHAPLLSKAPLLSDMHPSFQTKAPLLSDMHPSFQTKAPLLSDMHPSFQTKAPLLSDMHPSFQTKELDAGLSIS